MSFSVFQRRSRMPTPLPTKSWRHFIYTIVVIRCQFTADHKRGRNSSADGKDKPRFQSRSAPRRSRPPSFRVLRFVLERLCSLSSLSKSQLWSALAGFYTRKGMEGQTIPCLTPAKSRSGKESCASGTRPTSRVFMFGQYAISYSPIGRLSSVRSGLSWNENLFQRMIRRVVGIAQLNPASDSKNQIANHRFRLRHISRRR
jgi:hypothetical protein